MRPKTRKRKLFWQIFSSFLIISVTLWIIVTFYATATLRGYYLAQVRSNLGNVVALAGGQITEEIDRGNIERVDGLCKQYAGETKTRFTVIDEEGRVWGDSHYQFQAMESHRNRPEVQEALGRGFSISSRNSATLHEKMMYAARAWTLPNGKKLVVRVSTPLDEIESTVFSLQFSIALAWLAASICAGIAFFWFSNRISRPFESLKDEALSLVKSDAEAGAHLEQDQPDEAKGLSEAMGLMVRRLEERTSTISQQREELEAILGSMSEALLAIDGSGRILKINKRMAEVFGLDPETSRGVFVMEQIRNQAFNEFVQEALDSSDMVHAELTFYAPQPRYLQGSGTRLRDAEGVVIGAVVVLNDITQVKRLENLRKDFVANVSHELRTPITSIKGFVETLEEGALEDKEAAYRFLGIIARQTNRLGTIIEDLLSLSKIEQMQDRIQLDLEPLSLKKTLAAALRNVEPEAAKKKIKLKLDCPDDLEPKLHASLFEQAVVNLVDNAIKYSDGNKKVVVSARVDEKELKVVVTDQGVGIPRAHLPRLFERFYRVDKARSRAVGGTGLGLSIVKHIVVAHGGRVDVVSEVGQGSVFTITLPA